jgi:hypothetical protein
MKKMRQPFLCICFLSFFLLIFSSHLSSSSLQAAKLLLNGLIQSEKLGTIKLQSNITVCYTKLLGGEWKAYEPAMCRYLRENAGITETLYHENLNFESFEDLSAKSDSKSGESFWRSSSGNLIIKTIKHAECRRLRALLKEYCAHCLSASHLSCLSNVVGIYRIKLRWGRTYYFLVTKNIYHRSIQTNQVLSLKYDLKGSLIGRKKHVKSPVSKDLDLLAQQQPFCLGPVGKSILLETIHRDSIFLAKYQLMDYSLLVEIIDNPITTTDHLSHPPLTATTMNYAGYQKLSINELNQRNPFRTIHFTSTTSQSQLSSVSSTAPYSLVSNRLEDK